MADSRYRSSVDSVGVLWCGVCVLAILLLLPLFALWIGWPADASAAPGRTTRFTSARVSITGGQDNTVELGDGYKAMRLWVDGGGSAFSVCFDAAATAAMGQFDDTMVASYRFGAAVSAVHVFPAATTTINIEAWQ